MVAFSKVAVAGAATFASCTYAVLVRGDTTKDGDGVTAWDIVNEMNKNIRDAKALAVITGIDWFDVSKNIIPKKSLRKEVSLLMVDGSVLRLVFNFLWNPKGVDVNKVYKVVRRNDREIMRYGRDGEQFLFSAACEKGHVPVVEYLLKQQTETPGTGMPGDKVQILNLNLRDRKDFPLSNFNGLEGTIKQNVTNHTHSVVEWFRSLYPQQSTGALWMIEFDKTNEQIKEKGLGKGLETLNYMFSFPENHIFTNDGKDTKQWVPKILSPVNQVDNNGMSPLCRACYNGHLEIVELLLERAETEVNTSQNRGGLTAYHGETALFIACEKGYLDIVNKLLERSDVDVNKKTKLDFTPLTKMCETRRKKNSLEIIKKLLEHKQIDVNASGHHGRTPLMEAVLEGQTEVVKILLERNDVDVNKANHHNFGETPLSIACFYNIENQPEILEKLLEQKEIVLSCLLEHGEERKTGPHRRSNLMVNPKDGSTPLFVPCALGHLQAVQQLLMRTGFRVIELNKTNVKGENALMYAKGILKKEYDETGDEEKFVKGIRRHMDLVTLFLDYQTFDKKTIPYKVWFGQTVRIVPWEVDTVYTTSSAIDKVAKGEVERWDDLSYFTQVPWTRSRDGETVKVIALDIH